MTWRKALGGMVGVIGAARKMSQGGIMVEKRLLRNLTTHLESSRGIPLNASRALVLMEI